MVNSDNNINQAYDECTLRGICSVTPTTSAIRACILAYLQELAFYIKKVRAMGARNIKIKKKFLELFATLIPNYEYFSDNAVKIVNEIQDLILEIKSIYLQLCNEQSFQPEFYKTPLKFNKDFEITQIIKYGQKFEKKCKEKLTPEQKNAAEIISAILKSICIYLLELIQFDIDIEEYYQRLIMMPGHKNLCDLNLAQIKEILDDYSSANKKLVQLVFETRKKIFGPISESDVLISHLEGKSILVAGHNLQELKLILDATINQNINVYTHGSMVSAYTYEKFKTYPNLVGHYGEGGEYFKQDFENFPGPIFLTAPSLFKVDNLFHSRFFSSDKSCGPNVSRVQDYDFENLIKSAHNYKGFRHTDTKRTVKMGIDELNYYSQIDELIKQVESKKIKHLIYIGASLKNEKQKDYFNKLFDLLPDSCELITFSYKNNFKNSIFYNLDCAIEYVYKSLEKLIEYRKSHGLSISIFNLKCDFHSIGHLIYFSNLGIDKIFTSPCAPNLINPMLSNFINELYGIKNYSSAEIDIKNIVEF